jgi:SAM-dependent methyltransferase
MAYEALAALYDGLMEDIDYQQWVDYIQQLLEKHHCPGNRILDLGCGTGNITIPLAQKGYAMTAVDLSASMLEQARVKSDDLQLAINWQQQDMTQLHFADEDGAAPVFDAIIATFDAFNYLTEPEDLQDLLHQLRELLAEDGLLIFDVQTPYKLQTYLGNNIFTLHQPDVEYIWENHFDEETQICEMDITFFVRQENGLYQRVKECHQERVYDLDMLQTWLHFSDFTVLGVYRELTEQAVEPQDHRAVFVAKPMAFEDSWDAWDDETDFD